MQKDGVPEGGEVGAGPGPEFVEGLGRGGGVSVRGGWGGAGGGGSYIDFNIIPRSHPPSIPIHSRRLWLWVSPELAGHLVRL